MRLSGENRPDLSARTLSYALRIIKLYVALPKSTEAQVIGKQILRSGTSVGAHLAEAEHGKSRADFVCKVEGALQELEETRFWMRALIGAGIVRPAKLRLLMDETEELIKILVTIAHRAQAPLKAKRS